MPYSLSWYMEDRVVLAQVWGEMLLDGLETMLVDMNDFADTGREPVHIIADVLDVEKYPSNLKQLRHFAQIKPSAKISWSIIIVDNRLMAFFSTVINQLLGIKTRGFVTWEEGVNFLRSRDATLTSLSKMRPER